MTAGKVGNTDIGRSIGSRFDTAIHPLRVVNLPRYAEKIRGKEGDTFIVRWVRRPYEPVLDRVDSPHWVDRAAP